MSDTSQVDSLGRLLAEALPLVRKLPYANTNNRKTWLTWAEAWPARCSYQECMFVARLSLSDLEHWLALAGTRLAREQGPEAARLMSQAIRKLEYLRAELEGDQP